MTDKVSRPQPFTTYFASCLQNAAGLAEGRSPEAITEILDEYKELMLAAVEAEQGFPGKRFGDLILAEWGGLPSQTPQSTAVGACKAVARQLREISALNARRSLDLRPSIAIASGDFELCRLLMKACPESGQPALVSLATRQLCGEMLRFQELPALKDKAGGPLRIFKLI